MYYRQNKYRNKKTIIDGITFDSKKEANRYLELKILEKAGEIKDLKLQERFEVIPKQKGERNAVYKADFTYFDNKRNIQIVEDTKGFRTPDYVLKRKLFKLKYPDILFIEL